MQTVVMGTGYTGGRVLAALGRERASGFRRSEADPAAGVMSLDLDAAAPAPPALPARYALLYTVPPARDTPIDRRLERLLAMLEPPPRRIVYLSTSGVYGDCGGELVDEDRAPDPCTDRARRRLAAERRLEAWCAARDAALLRLRVPGIYGPGRLGVERIRAGQPVLDERDAHPGNRVHVDDLVAACIAALSEGAPAGIYNVCDGDHRSGTWFTQTVARLAGLPPPPVVSRARAESSFAESRLSFLAESRRLDNRRLRETLGVELRYPDAEAGIRASLAADIFVKAGCGRSSATS